VSDTTSTLRFGQRAKRIKTKVTATKVAGVGALTRELKAVKKKLATAQTENKSLLKKLAHVAQGGSAAPGTKHLVSLWQDRADSASAAGVVQQLKEQVVDLESKLRVAEKQQREGGNARLAELRVELDGLEHTKTELSRELEALKSNLGAAERYGEDLLAQLNESEKARAKAREDLTLAAASGDSTTAAMAELQSRTATAEASAAESLRALEQTRMKVAESTEASEAMAKHLELHKKVRSSFLLFALFFLFAHLFFRLLFFCLRSGSKTREVSGAPSRRAPRRCERASPRRWRAARRCSARATRATARWRSCASRRSSSSRSSPARAPRWTRCSARSTPRRSSCSEPRNGWRRRRRVRSSART
jgi:hypothetical protein